MQLCSLFIYSIFFYFFQPSNPKKNKTAENVKIRTQIQESNCDIIGDQFWSDNPEILEPKVKI